MSSGLVRNCARGAGTHTGVISWQGVGGRHPSANYSLGLWVRVFAGTAAASTSAAVGIEGAAPIRCTQIEAAVLA